MLSGVSGSLGKHHGARDHKLDIRVALPVGLRHLAGGGGNQRGFGIPLIHGHRGHDTGHMPPVRNQPPDQRRFFQGNITGAGNGVRCHLLSIFHQRRHIQLVAFDLGMLKVGQGIHPGGIRQRPGVVGERLDRFQGLRFKHLIALRVHHKQHHLIGGKAVLQRHEPFEIRVFLSEENTRIIIVAETLQPGGHGRTQRNTDKQHPHRVCHHPTTPRLFHCYSHRPLTLSPESRHR